MSLIQLLKVNHRLRSLHVGGSTSIVGIHAALPRHPLTTKKKGRRLRRLLRRQNRKLRRALKTVECSLFNYRFQNGVNQGKALFQMTLTAKQYLKQRPLGLTAKQLTSCGKIGEGQYWSQTDGSGLPTYTSTICGPFSKAGAKAYIRGLGPGEPLAEIKAGLVVIIGYSDTGSDPQSGSALTGMSFKGGRLVGGRLIDTFGLTPPGIAQVQSWDISKWWRVSDDESSRHDGLVEVGSSWWTEDVPFVPITSG